MKKRMRKKKQAERHEIYRGISMLQGWAGRYSYTAANGETQVMISFPTIEGYARDFTHARKCIDEWYYSGEARRYRERREHSEVPF